MKTFETMILKHGDVKLINAFVDDFGDYASAEFFNEARAVIFHKKVKNITKMSISEFFGNNHDRHGISRRVLTLCKRNGINSLKDLLTMTRDDFVAIPKIGPAMLAYVEKQLAQHNLHFA